MIITWDRYTYHQAGNNYENIHLARFVRPVVLYTMLGVRGQDEHHLEVSNTPHRQEEGSGSYTCHDEDWKMVSAAVQDRDRLSNVVALSIYLFHHLSLPAERFSERQKTCRVPPWIVQTD